MFSFHFFFESILLVLMQRCVFSTMKMRVIIMMGMTMMVMMMMMMMVIKVIILQKINIIN